MRTQRIVVSLAISIVSGIAVQNAASAQEYRGTWEQQMACTPDVMRLCGDQIPDANRIVACLRQNTALLGSSCRAVFESHASEQRQARQTPPRVPQQQVVPRARTGQPAQAQPRPYDPTQPRPYEDDE